MLGALRRSWARRGIRLGSHAAIWSRAISVAALALAVSPSAVAKPKVSGEFAYVPNYNSNTVSVISVPSSSVVATIPVGACPFSVAADSPRRTVYVGDQCDNDVYEIDMLTNTVTRHFTIDGSANGLAASADGKYLYATYNRVNGGSMAVIALSSGRTTARIDVGSLAYGVASDPRSRNVYVGDRNEPPDGHGVIYRVDGKTNTVTGSVDTAPLYDPLGIAVNPVDSRAYVAGDGGYVMVIDTATMTNIANGPYIGVDPWGITTNTDGTRLYVANRIIPGAFPFYGTVTVVDTATNAIIDTIPVGTYPVGVSYSPTTASLYVANMQSGNVSVIDATTDTVTQTIPVGVGPFAVGQFIASGGG